MDADGRKSSGPSAFGIRSRHVARVAVGLITAVGLMLVGGCLAFRQSLPKLSGTAALSGLRAPVVVERDGAGVPTILASSRLDLTRALGYLHAQDRYFQMDLYRRSAAGELAELVGPKALEQDTLVRLHGLKAVAEAAFRRLPAADQELLRTYAEGVNAGLAALRARPPEYVALRLQPRAWAPADSILILHAMALVLSDQMGEGESALGVMARALSPEALQFFSPGGTDWDAALDGSASPNPPLPSPEQFTAPPVDATNQVAKGESDRDIAMPLLGSNAFALAGWRTSSGSGTDPGPALVANDMHLELFLPNTWYRTRWIWNDDGSAPSHTAAQHDVNGTSLPGSPTMVIGSNRKVAWGFAAAALDASDIIIVETHTNHPGAYRVGADWKAFQTRTETIQVRGKPPVLLKVRMTEWGPVVPRTNAAIRVEAVRWVMHFPEAANLNSRIFEEADSVEDILAAAPESGLPWLNVIAGDADGHIGWTVGGFFPKRRGFDGRLPQSWANGAYGWDGWMEAKDYPRVIDPPSGSLWTANQRMTSDPRYVALGEGITVDLGARAKQIRDDLANITNAAPADLLAVQLDHRAIFLERWQTLLLSTLERSATTNSRLRNQWLGYVKAWGGAASVNSVGYRLVRAFRNHTHLLLFEPVQTLCRKVDPQFGGLPAQFEGPAWRMLEQKPSHLLNRRFTSYEGLLDQAWQNVMQHFPKPEKPLAQRTWGDRNSLSMQHPFSQGVPWLGRWLDTPKTQLPGDSNMPRVQADGMGASERMVVAPGREAEGIYHQPGGASGHFQSPYYLAGHQDWVRGKASPFLPGPAKHSLVLTPR